MTDQESLTERIRTFLLDPDTFFRQLAEKPARYRWPLSIAGIAGICTAVSSWLLLNLMTSFFTAGYAAAGPSAGLFSSLFTVIVLVTSALEVFTPFITLLIAGVTFFILASFISKGGSLTHAITATGWGMVPLAVYEAVKIPLLLAYLPSMSITATPEFFTLLSNSSSAAPVDKEAMMQMVTFSSSFYTYTMVAGCLHVVAYLCCAWFWIPGVKNTCAVSHRHAAMIVLIPLVLYLAIALGPALISGGHGL